MAYVILFFLTLSTTLIMIPKIIHFVWVGNNPKSELILNCIESWKTHLPDYKIMEWGNDAVAKIDNRYVQEAFENRKWAFVSDFIRLKALQEYGGFYFDTDLEITKNLDQFLDHEFISGFEEFRGKTSPITALMAAEKDSQFVSDLLNEYNNEVFVNADGSFNDKTNTQRISEYFFDKFNFIIDLDASKTVNITARITIFPYYYFCTPAVGKINFSIHHFDGSWHVGYLRNCIAKLGSFKLLLLRKIIAKSSFSLPIYGNEKLIWSSVDFLGLRLAFIRMR